MPYTQPLRGSFSSWQPRFSIHEAHATLSPCARCWVFPGGCGGRRGRHAGSSPVQACMHLSEKNDMVSVQPTGGVAAESRGAPQCPFPARTHAATSCWGEQLPRAAQGVVAMGSSNPSAVFPARGKEPLGEKHWFPQKNSLSASIH